MREEQNTLNIACILYAIFFLYAFSYEPEWLGWVAIVVVFVCTVITNRMYGDKP